MEAISKKTISRQRFLFSSDYLFSLWCETLHFHNHCNLGMATEPFTQDNTLTFLPQRTKSIWNRKKKRKLRKLWCINKLRSTSSFNY